MEVTLLLTVRGTVVAVFEHEPDARAMKERYNADPYLGADEPDLDAPYSIERWGALPRALLPQTLLPQEKP